MSARFRACLTLLGVLWPAASRAAATPAVAVMPFKDLSGGTAIGEAIRETVTTDLMMPESSSRCA